MFFSNKANTYLTGEARAIENKTTEDPTWYGRRIISALIDGSRGSLIPTIPERTKLKAFFIDDDRTAYIDMNKAIKTDHLGGIQSEMLTVYSIVNTLVLNIDEIRSVKLLVDGQEAATLVGHVDLKPLYHADMLWIR